MPLKFIFILIGSFLLQSAYATPPVEVIDSCKNSKPAKGTVVMTSLPMPAAHEDQPGCMDHRESTINNFNYGQITCNDKTSLIVKGNRYDLDTAVNHSVNPSISPDGDILPLSYWWKIEFNNNEYLCINTPLSPSGHGANVMQHYIVENPSNTTTPVIYFYFFDKEVMPITTTN
ncbi:hypothetical protein [Legionella erythra]|uniref:Secreted protein n=1 Tax=Legionella erythra TaxID=448 RepID=A0A0W0TQZ3_LEGER|nr:hypothetical protein [Legionella erythra]KTC97867.1 hypothetical protein Lery_1706 [Legionella erythra]HEM0351364.1 hypothetical protein [Legionella pneumophila]